MAFKFNLATKGYRVEDISEGGDILSLVGVDTQDDIRLIQRTPGQELTLPTPTDLYKGIVLTNEGTVLFMFYGDVIEPGQTVMIQHNNSPWNNNGGIPGIQGPQGPQGIQGPRGVSGGGGMTYWATTRVAPWNVDEWAYSYPKNGKQPEGIEHIGTEKPYLIPYDGKIVTISMRVAQARIRRAGEILELVVTVLVNGEPAGKPLVYPGSGDYITHLEEPIELKEGDILGFKTISVVGNWLTLRAGMVVTGEND